MKKIILALLMTMTLIATSACGSEAVKEEWVKLNKNITVEGIQYTVSAYKLSSGNDTFSPEDGKKYLYLDITAKNNTKEDYPISSELLFALTDSDGKEYDVSVHGLVAMDDEKIGEQLDVTVAASKEVRGGIAYEVPENAKGLTLTIKGLLKGEEKVALN